MKEPILYSFRRCPYAMRARLSLHRKAIRVELREIILRDKPVEFLNISPKATVPVMVLPNGQVFEESRDIMDWALGADYADAAQYALVDQFDAQFKPLLDRYKYPARYEDMPHCDPRDAAMGYLRQLDHRLCKQRFLFAEQSGYSDMAIAPFVRQFAHVDRDWFLNQNWPHLIGWYQRFIDSDDFLAIMQKYPPWQAGNAPSYFP